MTYGTRKSSRSPGSLKAPLAINAYRHKHNRRQTQDYSNNEDDDFNNLSQSPSLDEDEDEFDNPVDDSASYLASDSETNVPLSDQFSSPRPRSVSESANLNNLGTNTPDLSQPNTQTTSYLCIAPFPIFHGDSNECPVAHLSRFTKVCRANNVSSIEMAMRIFPITLENEAALWYDLNIEPYSSSLSWEEIKSSFLQAYNRIELADQLRSQLMTISQGSEESVRSYFLRLQWILNRWPDHGLTDNLLTGIFVDGLLEDFQDWINPQKPSSLNNALRLAFGFEQVRCIRGGVRTNAKCGFCKGLHEEKGCEVRERMRKLWLESKEKEKEKEKEGLMVGWERSESGAKVFGRSVSMAATSIKNEEEGGKEEDEVGLKKKRECQCWKHQCWKKKFERNNSILRRDSKGV